MLIITAVVSVSLAGLWTATKGLADLNEKIFNKRAILSAVEDYLPEAGAVSKLSDEEVQQIFEERIEQISLDAKGQELTGIKAEDINMAQERKKTESNMQFPLFIYENEGQQFYIVSVRGKGLWDEIWGSVALKNDLNTIAGVDFDHKSETPGLGAEIKDNPQFGEQFKGKKIYNDDGVFVSIQVVKGGAKRPYHYVDGITGATITADGVEEMMYRGLKYYEPYFEKLKKN